MPDPVQQIHPSAEQDRSELDWSGPNPVLDHPVWAALTGPHAGFAERYGQVARYPAEVSPLVAFADGATDAARADLAALAGPGAAVAVSGVELAPPAAPSGRS